MSMYIACSHAGFAQINSLHISPNTFVKVVGDAHIKLDKISWQNDGTFSAGSSTVEFQGSAATGGQILGTQVSTFHHLTVNRPGLSVQLGEQAQVNGNLRLEAGTLDLNGHDLILGQPGGSIINETETNRIVGNNGGEVVVTAALVSPGQINLGNIGATITSMADMGSTTIRRGHVPVTIPNTGASTARYYDIAPSNNANLNASLRFAYFDSELNGLSEANLALYRGIASTWQTGNAIGSGSLLRDGTQNWVQQGGINQFLDNWTLAETATTSCRATDSLALVQLYNATNGPSWTNPWNLAQPMTTWHGVTLNATGCVLGLDLSTNNLSGTLPNLDLPALETLFLSENKLTGSIPNFSLANLIKLYLPANQLSGSVPDFNLPNLQELMLASNQLTGSVPNFSKMPNLLQLSIALNRLTGSIPDFDQMPKLQRIGLYDNQLTGPIPKFSLTPDLEYIGLYSNQLSGPIPKFDQVNLVGLHLSVNKLTGPIPDLNLANLKDFIAINNQLSGVVPDLNLPSLIRFYISGNRLDALPKFTKLASLQTTTDSVTTYGNRLTFDDHLNNLNLFQTLGTQWNYAPQDSFYRDTVITAAVGQNLTVDLGIDAGVVSNNYDWNKVGGGIKTIVGDNTRTFNNIQTTDAGDYYVKVFNGNAPKLNLFSRKITIQVVSGCRSADSSELVKLYNATNGPNWTNKWDLMQPMTTWQGVKLNTSGCVQAITLSNNNLAGTLPATLDNLDSLTSFWVDINALSGTIPNFTIPVLRSLNLSQNQLSGSIPDFNLPVLEELFLNENQLSGPIPNFNLPRLRYMFFYTNQLSGSIPNFTLPNLEDMIIGTNQLTGTIPNFNLPNLKFLLLPDNQLNGNIPNFDLPKLDKLDLNLNKLTGMVPEFNKLPLLKQLNIAANNLDSMSTQNAFILSGQAFTALKIENNRFTFDDVAPNIQSVNFTGLPADRTYAPQDSFYRDTIFTATVGQNLTVDLGIDAGLSSNVHTWKKDLAPYTPNSPNSNKLVFNNLKKSDAGDYYVTVTNPGVPLLTLHGRRIRLSVACVSLSQNVAQSICPGQTFFFNNQNISLSGIYKDTLTAFNGCDSIVTLTLTALSKPPADAGPNQRVCAGSNVTLTATGGQTYRWDDGSTNATLQFAPQTAGFRFVTVTDVNGCAAKDSVRVDVDLVPQVTITGPSSVCAGGSVDLTATGGTSYLWSTGSTRSTITVTAAVLYSVTATDGNGCTASTSKTIVQSNMATASISGAATFCPGGNTTLTAGGGTTFLWNTGATTAQITVNAAQTYTVTVTAAGGCTGTASQTVSALPAPTPKIGTNGLFGVCAGDSVALSPGVFSLYRWSTGATTGTIKVPSKDNLYTVTVTGTNNCTATATASITELARTVAQIAPPDTLDCATSQITLDGSGSSSGILFSAVWSTTNGNIVSGGNTLKPAVDKPGVYQLVVTGPSPLCPNTATVTVIEQKQQPSNVSLTTKGTSCAGQNDGLVIIGNITGGLPPFAFSLNGGTFLTGVDTFKNLAPGDYTLKIQGRNACFLTKTFTIQEGVGPKPDLGSDRTVCIGTSVMFDAGAFATYLWSNGVANQPTITVSQAGIYTVTVTDAKGCRGSDMVELKHHPLVTAKAVSTDTLTCVKAQVTLSSTGTTTGTNIQYSWTTKDGKIDAGGNTPSPTASEGGTYQLIVRNTQTTCADTAKVSVVEMGKPVTNIDLKTNDARCFSTNDGVIAVNAVGSGTTPFSYRLDNGPFQPGGTFDNLPPGTYLLTVRGADGCEASGTTTIDEPDALMVLVKSSGLLQGGASSTLATTVSGAQGDVRYAWDGPDLSCSDCAAPKISPQFNASYTLTVTDEKGCATVAFIFVPVKSNLGPDIITPGNEDGQNDELIFDDLDKEPAKSANDITIFNRWGQKVFTARPYLNDWKGTDDKGRELPEGTYYYVLNLRDGIKNAVHGSVLIVR